MDRRWTGLIVLVCAAVALVVLPGAMGTRVAGTAAPDSSLPIVGDCLTQPGYRDADTDFGATPPALPTEKSMWTYAGRGDCAAPGAARVLSTTVRPTVEPGSEWNGGSRGFCASEQKAVDARLRTLSPALGTDQLFTQGDEPTDNDLSPSLSLWVQPTWEPGPQPQVVSCVISVPTASAPAAELTDSDLAAIPRCSVGPLTGSGYGYDGRIPCGQPHRIEVMGWFVLSFYSRGDGSTLEAAPPDRKLQLATCRRFVTELVGRDLSAERGVQVEVRQLGDRSGGAEPPPWGCIVTTSDPDAMLTGMLVGLGADPLPWAP